MMSVRAVVLTGSARDWHLVEVLEERIREPEAPAPEDVDEDAAPVEEDDALLSPETLDALRRIAARGVFEDAESVTTAIAGDRVFLTDIGLPFRSPKEVAAVLAPQLDGRLPVDVDELVVDYMELGRETDGEHHFLAGGARISDVAEFLGTLQQFDIDPRAVEAPPLHLHAAARKLLPASDGPIALVDIGAQRSRMIVCRGDELHTARSLYTGGEALTESLAATFGLDLSVAREGKHREGRIDAGAVETGEVTGNDTIDISNACRNAIKPLIRDLRRTLQAHAGSHEQPVGAIYISGATAALPGLASYIEQSVGVPTAVVPTTAEGLQTLPQFSDIGHRFVSAIGLALGGFSRSDGTSFNLRQGAFEFKGGYEYITGRVGALALGMLILALAASFSMFARVRMLKAEDKAVTEAMSTLTARTFGVAIDDPALARPLALRNADTPFMSDYSAYDALADITGAVQATQDGGSPVVPNAFDIDMATGRVRISGSCASAQAAEDLGAALQELDCMHEVNRTELSERRGEEDFTFTFQAVARCGELEDDE